eukprot:2499166-Lingulodinium_polyedra.AAC.1
MLTTGAGHRQLQHVGPRVDGVVEGPRHVPRATHHEELRAVSPPPHALPEGRVLHLLPPAADDDAFGLWR